MNNECLAHYSGTDTSNIIRMFKIACLNYSPSEIVYRDNEMSRGALMQLRRELVDKVTAKLTECHLFSENVAYPRRYYDDLVIE